MYLYVRYVLALYLPVRLVGCCGGKGMEYRCTGILDCFVPFKVIIVPNMLFAGRGLSSFSLSSLRPAIGHDIGSRYRDLNVCQAWLQLVVNGRIRDRRSDHEWSACVWDDL